MVRTTPFLKLAAYSPLLAEATSSLPAEYDFVRDGISSESRASRMESSFPHHELMQYRRDLVRCFLREKVPAVLKLVYLAVV